jgi:hypothetical protein
MGIVGTIVECEITAIGVDTVMRWITEREKLLICAITCEIGIDMDWVIWNWNCCIQMHINMIRWIARIVH